MERYLMEKFKKILEDEKDISNIKMFMNVEGSIVVKYEYNNEKYVISIEDAYWLD